MDSHLGYKKNSNSGDNNGNSRNGYSTKKVLTGDGQADILIPRDRNSEFDPMIVPKYACLLPLFNDQIISLYSRGMTTRDILISSKREIYSVEVSSVLRSNVTFAVFEDVKANRTRPLSYVYPIVYLDALLINSRESGKNQNKALYIALGIKREGRKEGGKDLKAIYSSPTEDAALEELDALKIKWNSKYPIILKS